MVQVVTDQPLKKILSRPEVSGRVVAWSIELGESDLEYITRTAIKAQALADFIVECRAVKKIQKIRHLPEKSATISEKGRILSVAEIIWISSVSESEYFGYEYGYRYIRFRKYPNPE